jgi:hypothetical protein
VALTRDLVIVRGTETMVLCISIEEHPELKESVRAVLNARNHSSWRECSLVDIAMVVLWILIQVKLSKLLHLVATTVSNNVQ